MDMKVKYKGAICLFLVGGILSCAEPVSNTQDISTEDGSESAESSESREGTESTEPSGDAEESETADTVSSQESDAAGEPVEVDAEITTPPNDTQTGPSPEATIRFTGIAQYWETDESATDCTVCVHDQDECTSVLSTGLFTLDKVPVIRMLIHIQLREGNPDGLSVSYGQYRYSSETIFVIREQSD